MSDNDSSFASGPWTGFYTYNLIPGKHPTDLILKFSRGRITGEGRDKVGSFVIDGDYDPETRECSWLKSYVGRHDVHYRAFRDAKGIWGTWQDDKSEPSHCWCEIMGELAWRIPHLGTEYASRRLPCYPRAHHSAGSALAVRSRLQADLQVAGPSRRRKTHSRHVY
jgi:hypothetical protein